MAHGPVLAVLVTCSLLLGCTHHGGPGSPGAGGDQVVFTSNRDGDHEVYVHTISTGLTAQLTDNEVMDYGVDSSPDGALIAFGSERDGNPEIYTMGFDGAGVRRLTDHEADDKSPAWSPDGTRIAFVSERDSPRGEIYVMDADGSNVRRITTNDRYDEVPAWSPDGRRLAFGALAAGDDGESLLQVFVLDLGDGAERQLTSLPGHNSAPRWSPDGSLIAFYGNVGRGFAGADIFTISPDGTGLVNLTSDEEPDWQPDWTSDGSRIVFTRGPSNPLDLWVMDADGSNRERIVHHDGRDEQPRWRKRSK